MVTVLSRLSEALGASLDHQAPPRVAGEAVRASEQGTSSARSQDTGTPTELACEPAAPRVLLSSPTSPTLGC